MAFIDAIDITMEMAIVREWSLNRVFVKFWRCSLKKILMPAAMNMFALNMACVKRWKKHRCGILSPSVITISPS